MSWGTYALVPVYLSRETFTSKDQLVEYIKECNASIEQCKKDLYKVAAMTEPQKFCGEDEDPLGYTDRIVTDSLELIEEYSYKAHIADLMLEAWDDAHHPNGGAYYQSEKRQDLAWMSGDYIPVVDRDGKPHIYTEAECPWGGSKDSTRINMQLCEQNGIIERGATDAWVKDNMPKEE